LSYIPKEMCFAGAIGGTKPFDGPVRQSRKPPGRSHAQGADWSGWDGRTALCLIAQNNRYARKMFFLFRRCLFHSFRQVGPGRSHIEFFFFFWFFFFFFFFFFNFKKKKKKKIKPFRKGGNTTIPKRLPNGQDLPPVSRRSVFGKLPGSEYIPLCPFCFPGQ